MVRTQVQLTKKQAAMLKKRAAEEGVSLAELVRRGVDLYLRNSATGGDENVRQRALRAVGRFASGGGDLSERHDEYLSKVYR